MRPIYLICLLVTVLFDLGGCALLRPADKERTKYILDQLPAQIPLRSTHQATLVVLTPQTSAVYNTNKMAYTTSPHQIDYYNQSEWASTPSQMLQPLIIHTLQKTHYFRAVVAPLFMDNNTYFLKTEVFELLQDFTVKPAMLRMNVRATITSSENDAIVASTGYSVAEPICPQTAKGGALAANRATAKILHNISMLISKIK